MLLAHVFKLVSSLLEESEVGICHRIRAARKQTSVQCERCTGMFTHHSLCVCLQCQPLQSYSATTQACQAGVWTILTIAIVCTRVTFTI